jgi:hypothetical protein
MPYRAEISRANPTCFLFLIDQSTSMADPFGGQSGLTKADGVSDAINRLLQNLVIKCSKPEGVRDYFHVGVIGYGRDVAPALGGDLAGRPLSPISEVERHPLRIEERVRKVPDGAGGLVDQVTKFPVWFEPVANGRTPMCRALEMAWQVVGEFVANAPACHPPIVLNITDGEANDGDPEPVAAQVLALESSDGKALLFNAHLSSRPDRAIEFADREDGLPDEHARRLFRMSSTLPPKLREAARVEGFQVGDESRGFVFNADLVSVIRFLDIGTRVDGRNLR